ncbi:MAG: hypothetical protein KJO81_01610 [Gammaproteobacteria bacterium]|nr:hypothetical protein [Gammaproteobacteria bacterium]
MSGITTQKTASALAGCAEIASMVSLNKSSKLHEIFRDASQEDIKEILEWIMEKHWKGERAKEWDDAIREWHRPEDNTLQEMNKWLREQNESLLYLLSQKS